MDGQNRKKWRRKTRIKLTPGSNFNDNCYQSIIIIDVVQLRTKTISGAIFLKLFRHQKVKPITTKILRYVITIEAKCV